MKSIIKIICLVLMVACTDETCSVENPVEELDWLKSIINEFEEDEETHKYTYIIKGFYKNNEVYVFGNCNPAINYIPLVRNCEGEILNQTNEGNYMFIDVTLQKEIIWRSPISECNL